LLTSALIPFPTAILSAAIQGGNEFDARVAVALYATIAGTMCLSWLVVFHVLSNHPYLLEDGVNPDFFPKERFRATLGVILYAIAGVAGWLSTSKVSLLIFLALPVFLRHHQRRFDGNTDTPPISKSSSRGFGEARNFGEKRSRGTAH
jgi:hypothetical protein